MGALLTDARDRLESTAFTLGTGTNEPTGIVTALAGTASVVASATADAYAVDDVYAVSEALPARHWANATWLAHRSIIKRTRKFGTAGSHAFVAHLDTDSPPLLLGKRLYENSEMDGTPPHRGLQQLHPASGRLPAICGRGQGGDAGRGRPHVDGSEL